MASLEYSLDAMNVKSSFYRAKAMLYVEGDDDVMFWHEIVRLNTSLKVEIEQVGGADALDTVISKVEAGEVDALVARDADLLPLLVGLSANPRIMYTFGYSIENSLYYPEALCFLAKTLSKNVQSTVEGASEWLSSFTSEIIPLLELDVANGLDGGGLYTIGDNCSRFMKSKHSASLCSERVASYASEVGNFLRDGALDSARAVVHADLNTAVRFVRGHFLASAALKYVTSVARQAGKKVSISLDSLYAGALACFSRDIASNHPHRVHYKVALDKACGAL